MNMMFVNHQERKGHYYDERASSQIILSTVSVIMLMGMFLMSCAPNPSVLERGKDVNYQMNYIGTDQKYSKDDPNDPCMSFAHFPTLTGPDDRTGAFNRWIWGQGQQSVAITLDCLANPEEFEIYDEDGITLWKLQRRTIVKLTMDTRGIYSGFLNNIDYLPGAATASSGDVKTFNYDVVTGRFLEDEDVFIESYDHVLKTGLKEKIMVLYDQALFNTWLWMLSEEGLTFIGTDYLHVHPDQLTLTWDEVTEFVDWNGMMGEIFPEHSGK
jgi:hypothetical protein